MEKEYLHSLFEKHLDGSILPEEKNTLDALLENPEIQEELKLFQLANEALVDYNFLKLKEQMEVDLETISPQNSWWKFVFVGTAVVFSIVAYLLFYKLSEETPLVLKEEPRLHTEESVVLQDSLEGISSKEVSIGKNAESTGTIVNQKPISTLSGTEKVKDTIVVSDSWDYKEKKNSDLIPELGKEVVTGKKEEQVEKEKKPSADNTTVLVKSINLVVEASCNGKANGQVEVTEIFTEPENAKIDVFLEPNYHRANNVFSNLPPGSYTVKTRIDGVESVYRTVTIEEKQCLDQNEFVIAPSHGEMWNIPVDEYGDVSITVMDERGGVHKIINVKDKMPNTWDLKNEQGAFIPNGYYVLIISGKNGNFKRFLRVIE